MKAILIVIFVIAICFVCEAPADDYNIYGYDFYASSFFPPVAAGRGYTGFADKGDMSLSIINPAAMTNIEGFQAIGGYTYKTEAETHWGYDNYEYHINLDPQKQYFYLGFGYSISNNIQVGLMFNETSKYRLIDEDIYYATGNIYKDTEILSRTTVSLPVSIILSTNTMLGLTLDVFKQEVEEHHQEDYLIKQCYYSWCPKVGFVYQPCKRFSLGAIYGASVPVKKSKYYNFYLSNGTVWADTIVRVYRPPQTVGIGFKWSARESHIDIYSDYQCQIFPETYFEFDELRKWYRTKLSVGLEILHKKYSYRAGILSEMNGGFSSVPIHNFINGQYNFLTGGFTKNIGPIGVTLAIMDSHLLSTGQYQYTQVGIGFSY